MATQISLGAGIERRNCPICAHADGPTVLTHERWRLVECSNCGLAYMPEIPSAEAIDTEFEWDESFKRERLERWLRNPLFRAWTGLMMFLRPPRELRALKWIQGVVPGGRLLDIGCGDGRLVAIAVRRGFDALGIEVSPAMAKKALRRLPAERVMCGRLADFPLAPASFDAIVTVSYMEHEPRPLELMRQAAGLLRPGGFAIHKAPNYASKLRSIMGQRWSGYRWPEHFQYYTPTTLGRLMEAAGFEVVRVTANPLGDNFWIAGKKR